MKESDLSKLLMGAVLGLFVGEVLKGTLDPPKAPTSPIWSAPLIPVGLFSSNEVTITKDNTTEENSE